jgi:hypothetical protein
MGTLVENMDPVSRCCFQHRLTHQLRSHRIPAIVFGVSFDPAATRLHSIRKRG